MGVEDYCDDVLLEGVSEMFDVLMWGGGELIVFVDDNVDLCDYVK